MLIFVQNSEIVVEILPIHEYFFGILECLNTQFKINSIYRTKKSVHFQWNHVTLAVSLSEEKTKNLCDGDTCTKVLCFKYQARQIQLPPDPTLVHQLLI